MSNTISVRPRTDQKEFNLGLEKYGHVLFPGTYHTLGIWEKEDIGGSGMGRPMTGLDEFAPELDRLPEDERKSKVKEIRKAVAFLEKTLAANELNVNDKDFWGKVKVIRRDNLRFWKNIIIAPSNEAIVLDPKDPEGLIKIFAIEAGGFPDIAPSLEEAQRSSSDAKFYLDKLEKTSETQISGNVLETKAKAVLLDLYENNLSKLNYVAKVVDANSIQYVKSTPSAVLFKNMFEYIEGKMDRIGKKESAKRFLNICDLDMETLKLRSLVKDANFYGYVKDKNGKIYEGNSELLLGENSTDVVEYLKNPLNEQVFTRMLKRIENHWNE